MNREIKFTAFHQPTGRIFPVYSITPQYVFEDSLDGIHTTATQPADREECVLLQYTGFKDCTGREIYEGNILKSPLGNIVTVFMGKTKYELKGFPKNMNTLTVTGWLVINNKGVVDALDETFAAGEVIGDVFHSPKI